MVEKVRNMRSDARDNRARIVAAAIEIIEQQGTMASLNEIAKRAGIGPGTLYRHFPTRDELLAEVLVAWVARVEAAADTTVIASKSDLVDWLDRLALISNAYRGLAASIAAVADDANSPLQSAHSATLRANDRVFAQGREIGLFDGPVDAGTVGRLVTGVAMVTEQAALSAEQTRAMLEVVLDGLLVHAASNVQS
jgi:AcrR family transcriptional regulator